MDDHPLAVEHAPGARVVIRHDLELHYACCNDLPSAVHSLLTSAASGSHARSSRALDVNALDSRGDAALHLCVRHNACRALQVMLAHTSVEGRSRVDVHVKSRGRGQSALHLAAEHRVHDAVSMLLEHGASLVAARDDGFTPWHVAASMGDLTTLARMLPYVSNPSHVDVVVPSTGESALHIAARCGVLSVVTWLVETAGCSTSTRARNGRTASDVATASGHGAVAAWLREEARRGASRVDAWMAAARSDSDAALRALCEGPHALGGAALVNVLLARAGGDTLLHAAARASGREQARCLVYIRALAATARVSLPVDAVNGEGWTALHIATARQSTAGVRCLLDAGADANIVNDTDAGVCDRLGLKLVTEGSITRAHVSALMIAHALNDDIIMAMLGAASAAAVLPRMRRAASDPVDVAAATAVGARSPPGGGSNTSATSDSSSRSVAVAPSSVRPRVSEDEIDADAVLRDSRRTFIRMPSRTPSLRDAVTSPSSRSGVSTPGEIASYARASASSRSVSAGVSNGPHSATPATGVLPHSVQVALSARDVVPVPRIPWEQMQVREWLASIHLSQYSDALIAHGFDALPHMRYCERDAMLACGMKPAHVAILSQEIGKLAARPGKSEAVAADAATAGFLGPAATSSDGPIPVLQSSPASAGNVTSTAPADASPLGVTSPVNAQRLLARDSPLSRFVIRGCELVLGDCVGRGSVGSVHIAHWRGTDVAVKVLRSDLFSALSRADSDTQRQRRARRALDDLENEACVCERVSNHTHIVGFRGVILDQYLALVTEFMPWGSAEEVLIKRDSARYRRGDLSTYDIVRMATEASTGLLHLHQSSVIHRDMAARNLLLSSSGVCKVADFGFARVRENMDEDAAHQSTGAWGPLHWMAPESLRERRTSPASDVYAFGVTLWEMFTGCSPAAHWGSLASCSVYEYTKRVIDGGERLPLLPAFTWPHERIPMLLTEMWQTKASERPDMSHIVLKLKGMLAELSARPRVAARVAAVSSSSAVSVDVDAAARRELGASGSAADGAPASGAAFPPAATPPMMPPMMPALSTRGESVHTYGGLPGSSAASVAAPLTTHSAHYLDGMPSSSRVDERLQQSLAVRGDMGRQGVGTTAYTATSSAGGDAAAVADAAKADSVYASRGMEPWGNDEDAFARAVDVPSSARPVPFTGLSTSAALGLRALPPLPASETQGSAHGRAPVPSVKSGSGGIPVTFLNVHDAAPSARHSAADEAYGDSVGISTGVGDVAQTQGLMTIGAHAASDARTSWLSVGATRHVVAPVNDANIHDAVYAERDAVHAERGGVATHIGHAHANAAPVVTAPVAMIPSSGDVGSPPRVSAPRAAAGDSTDVDQIRGSLVQRIIRSEASPAGLSRSSRAASETNMQPAVDDDVAAWLREAVSK